MTKMYSKCIRLQLGLLTKHSLLYLKFKNL